MKMFKAECFIERIQTEWVFAEEFDTLEEAQEYCAKDFETRCRDSQFVNHGGYYIYVREWRRFSRPEMVVKPTLNFVEFD
jgi:hypothetical protein